MIKYDLNTLYNPFKRAHTPKEKPFLVQNVAFLGLKLHTYFHTSAIRSPFSACT